MNITNITLSLQKSEGSRAKASKGEAVVGYCESLVTQDLELSGFPEGQTTWQQSIPSLECTGGWNCLCGLSE